MDLSPNVISIAQRKLELEERRIANEEKQTRGWRIYLTPISIAFLAAVILFGLWYQVRSDFQLKAAEIAMDANSPVGAASKANALQELFGVRLDTEFASKLNPTTNTEERQRALEYALLQHPEASDELIRIWLAFHPLDASWARDLLNLTTNTEERKRALEYALLQHPEASDELIRIWIAFHPLDASWASDLLKRD